MSDELNLTATVQAMQVAQRAWADESLPHRVAVLRTVAERYALRASDLADTVCAETKKSPTDAWFADVLANLELFEWWTKEGPKLLGDARVPISAVKMPGKSAVLRYEAKGIVGLISPWNYPIALPLRSLIPALLAGNGVLFKPSEVTPKCGALIGEIFNEVLPSGLLVVVQGAAEAGRAVVDAADHVIFTGSVATGRAVAIRCAEQLKGASLELGGKDAAIVLKDCALDRTIQGVFWGAMANSGQNCAAIERVYVEAPIYEAFVTGMVKFAGVYPIAPVATEAQDALIRRHLADATERGATLHGTYPGAVIVTGLPDDALLMTEETFGPICPIVKVDSADAGLRRANSGDFGLTTSIWTQDETRAKRLAIGADSGVVTINNHGLTGAFPFAPWAGRGLTGTGVTNSSHALMEMVHTKFVLTDKGKDPDPWWFPGGDGAVTLAKKSMGFLAAAGLGKLSHVFGVLGEQKRRLKEQREAMRR